MLETFISIEQIERLKDAIAHRTSYDPKVGLILGSGLGPLADRVSNPERIPYTELPYWPISTVTGHQGQLVIGKLEGQSVLIMQGRTHYYEGYPMSYIGLPVSIIKSNHMKRH